MPHRQFLDDVHDQIRILEATGDRPEDREGAYAAAVKAFALLTLSVPFLARPQGREQAVGR